jgi:hypothetical protein
MILAASVSSHCSSSELWSDFVPSAPSAATQSALEQLYVSSARSID